MKDNKEGLYEFDSRLIPKEAWKAFFRPAYIYTSLCPIAEFRCGKENENELYKNT